MGIASVSSEMVTTLSGGEKQSMAEVKHDEADTYAGASWEQARELIRT